MEYTELQRRLYELENKVNELSRQGFQSNVVISDNIRFKKISGTTNASAGTESTHAHLLGKTPKMIMIIPTSNAVIYQSKAADATNIYLKASENSATFEAYVL